MPSKVLVADDSKTIQKVIGITLASENYDLEECLNEKNLFAKLKSNKYDLVIVDFELSDKKSGVELAQEISQIVGDTPIMAMLGTFDNIDEDSLKRAKINDKISKPFDGVEFIQKCRGLIKPDGHDPLDNWSVDEPDPQEDEPEEDKTLEVALPTAQDPLRAELEDWGVSVPPAIGQTESPPVSLPPEIEKTQEFQLEGTEPSYMANLDKNKADIESERFWSADEELEEFKHESMAKPTTEPMAEPTAESTKEMVLTSPIETDNPIQEDSSSNKDSIDKDALVRELKEAFAPEIESIAKKYCSQKIEEIAWEVIPDLAENLIREEIKEISHRLEGKDITR